MIECAKKADMEELTKIRYHAPGQPVHNIPEASGVYAWYAPLYIFEHASAPEMVEFYNRLFLWELAGNDKGEVDAQLAWKRIKLKLKPHERHDPLKQESNQKILEDSKVRKWLKCAGVFTPPLYVGMATNLRSRYEQHAEGADASVGNFAGRIGAAIKKLNHHLTVDSLIFAYMETHLAEKDNHAIESFVMRAAMPPFSKQ